MVTYSDIILVALCSTLVIINLKCYVNIKQWVNTVCVYSMFRFWLLDTCIYVSFSVKYLMLKPVVMLTLESRHIATHHRDKGETVSPQMDALPPLFYE